MILQFITNQLMDIRGFIVAPTIIQFYVGQNAFRPVALKCSQAHFEQKH